MKRATNPTKQCLNATIKKQMIAETKPCSWCNPGAGDEKTSHGMCDAHLNQMLADIKADKEKREQIQDVIATCEVLPEHKRIVDDILSQRAAKESEEKASILLKPQTTPGDYQTKTNGRNQTITSRKEKEVFYGGIQIS